MMRNLGSGQAMEGRLHERADSNCDVSCRDTSVNALQ